MIRKTIFFVLIISAKILTAQINISEEGLYYTDNKELYTGEYIEKHDNDSIKLKMLIKDGKPDGMTNLFFENGNKSESRSYKEGEMHGTWVTWDEKGTKIAEANYSRDIKNGKWYIWDANGTLRYEMTYLDGKKTGIWYMWNEKGELVSEKEY